MVTILSVLDNYSDDYYLKVGTTEGGWFYIGGVGDYKKRYKEIDQIVKAYDIGLKERAVKSIINLIHHSPKPKESVNNEGIEKFNKELWETEIAAYLENLEIKAKLYEKHSKFLENYSDISVRQVTDFFKADPVIKEHCLNIVIEGIERGRYWDHTDDKFGSICFLSSKCSIMLDDFIDEDNENE